MGEWSPLILPLSFIYLNCSLMGTNLCFWFKDHRIAWSLTLPMKNILSRYSAVVWGEPLFSSLKVTSIAKLPRTIHHENNRTDNKKKIVFQQFIFIFVKITRQTSYTHRHIRFFFSLLLAVEHRSNGRRMVKLSALLRDPLKLKQAVAPVVWVHWHVNRFKNRD